MSAWTEGPWRVEEGTTLVWGACDPEDHSSYGMGFPVAEARTVFPNYARNPPSDNGEANARLIAAAPDLFEALEMIRDADEDCIKDGLHRPLTDIARAKVDAALARAGG